MSQKDASNVVQFPVANKRTGKKSPSKRKAKSKKPAANKLLEDFSKIISESPDQNSEKNTTINIDNSTGIQVGDNATAHYHFHQEKKSSPKILPPQNSIGGDALLKKAIKDRFDALGERRTSRLRKNAYGAMYSNFKKEFKIPKETAWTVIWTWPASTAPAIISYLDDKLSNTIEGRIENAASREGYIHNRRHLYKREKELLEHFDLAMDSPEVREQLEACFGTRTHTKLTHLQHWHWVCHLEAEVKKLEESD